MRPKVNSQDSTHLLRKGDEAAFAQIYHQHKQALYYFALRYLKDKALAEDALQEVFVKLWNGKDKLDPKQPLKGFLFTCMKHHVLNTIRSEETRIRHAALAVAEVNPDTNFTEQEVAFVETKGLLEKGIQTLSAGKKMIFKLSFEEGCSNREIATRLNISEHTVRSQLSQSTRFLRKHLKNAVSILFALLAQF